LNEKRKEILAIESRNNIQVTVLPNTEMQTPDFEVVRIRNQDADSSDFSYKLANELSKPEEEVISEANAPQALAKPAVKTVIPSTPAPVIAQTQSIAPEKSQSFVKRLWATMFGETEEPKKEEPKKRPNNTGNNRNRNRNRNNRGRQNNRRGNDRSNENLDSASSKKPDSSVNAKGPQSRNNRRNKNAQPKDAVVVTEAPSENKEGTTDSKVKTESSGQLKKRPNDKRRGPRRPRQRQEVSEELLTQTNLSASASADGVDQTNQKPTTNSQDVILAAEDTATPDKDAVSGEQAVKPKRKSSAKPKKAKSGSDTSPDPSVDKSSDPSLEVNGKPKKPRVKKSSAPKKNTNDSDLETNKSDSPIGRASNDPRKKPKPVVEVEVSTERVKVATPETVATAVTPKKQPKKAPARAANDPRKKRAPAKVKAGPKTKKEKVAKPKTAPAEKSVEENKPKS
jgi:ribonuclease E